MAFIPETWSDTCSFTKYLLRGQFSTPCLENHFKRFQLVHELRNYCEKKHDERNNYTRILYFFNVSKIVQLIAINYLNPQIVLELEIYSVFFFCDLVFKEENLIPVILTIQKQEGAKNSS